MALFGSAGEPRSIEGVRRLLVRLCAGVAGFAVDGSLHDNVTLARREREETVGVVACMEQ
jgi:hypothetical protein